MTHLLTVAEVAARSELSTSAVRYYHRLGLLTAHDRARGSHRRFDEAVLDRLRFIRSAQRLGLSLAEITELLSVRDGAPGPRTEHVLRRHLGRLEAAMVLLQELQQEMSALLVLHTDASAHAVRAHGPSWRS
ncbi:MerR family DNA-binding protein [Streptomyces sennicomposti]|uniref:MerR family DNA-binding protein n=1 Tax=Streptomyces sennicomposti TaxID=2873384 RepID=UPI001CA72142|nr:MerR family DNA-binding protein [Streptomyces sennicomposti]MBY8864495.1 MerR family DNA-binding protein [Streptomyces sennicomposti]